MAPYANQEIKKIKDREYREQHKEQLKQYFRKLYADHKEEILVKHRESYHKNRDKRLIKGREYYYKNRQKRKEYIVANREKIREYDRKLYHKKCATDILYRLRRSVRTRISCALHRNVSRKDADTLLGCTLKDLKQYIELQFQPGMTWGNYGHKTWHIDHIIPCSMFNLNNTEEIKRCFHYTNIQPIWAIDNLKKGTKIGVRYKNRLSYAYNQEECQKEYENICHKKTGDLRACFHLNKIVLTYQPHFYEVENNLWKNPEIRDFIIENRKKYIQKDEWELNDKEVLRAFKISAKHIGFSHFNPLWIKWFIEKYNVSSIYDPCCGWGHRLLGAHNIRYIGNDLDNRTTEGLKKIITDFSMKDKTIYNNDCTTFSPLDEYEAVFTCPPYYNTEIYQGKIYNNLEEYETFLEKMFRNSMKPSVKVLGIVINHTYKDLLINVANRLELDILEQVELGTQTNHFQRSGNNRKAEYMIIFHPKIGTKND